MPQVNVYDEDGERKFQLFEDVEHRKKEHFDTLLQKLYMFSTSESMSKFQIKIKVKEAGEEEKYEAKSKWSKPISFQTTEGVICLTGEEKLTTKSRGEKNNTFQGQRDQQESKVNRVTH